MYGDGETRDRGQILLISSLLIAVMFVGLAVVVNSAIYTENRATREVTRSSEAIADHPVTQERLSRTIHEANFGSDTAGYDERNRNVAENVSSWDSEMQSKEATNGNMFGARVVDRSNGTRISQDEFREFRPHHTDYLDEALLSSRLDPLGLFARMSWLVAQDVKSHGYRATVNRTSLKDTTTNLEDVVTFVLNGNHAFGIVFDEGTQYHTVYLLEIEETGDENDIAAVVSKENGSSDEKYVGHCRVEAANATIRLDKNEISGNGTTEDCPAFSFTEGLGRHDIYYVGVNNSKGTYDVIVDKKKDPFDEEIDEKYNTSLLDDLLNLGCLVFGCDPPVYVDPGNGQPYTARAVYDTTVELSYTDDRVHLTRNVSVPA